MDDDSERVTNVLVVDDNPGDRRFIEEALKSSRLDPTVRTVNTRDNALDVVSQRGEYEDAAVPDVILLDWNLSQTTGQNVLEAATSSDVHISVIVMTGSESEIERVQSSLPQADLFIEKPTEPAGYIEAIRSVLNG